MTARTPRIRKLATAFFVALSALVAGTPAIGATPGLPFSENFANTALKDDVLTTAKWEDGQNNVQLGEAATLDNLSTTASALGTDVDGQTRDIVTADFDGDGDLDLLAGNSGLNNVIYFNNGGFAEEGVPLVDGATRTQTLAVADIDGDGDIDFVEGNNGQPPRLFLNNGNGTFAAAVPIESRNIAAWDLSIVDLDLDGDLDIVLAAGRRNLNTQDNRNRVYRNQLADTGALTFTAADLGNDRRDSRAVATGDLNGDGYPDVVFGELNNIGLGGQTSGENTVHLSDGEGNLSGGSPVNAEADQTFAVVLADMDSDGNLDLVTGNQQQVTRIYGGNGDGTFGAGNTVSDSSNTDTTVVLIVEDFDRDADLDIIEGNNPQTKRIFLNNGDGTFSNGLPDFFPVEALRTYGMASGDFNQDGIRDVAAGHQVNDTPGDTTNKFYTFDGDETGNIVRQLSSIAVSARIDDSSIPEVASVKLTATDSVPAGTAVRYFVSNTNGSTFVAARSGVPIVFPDRTGGALKWRAELETDSGSGPAPTVDQIDIAVNNAPVHNGDEPCGQPNGVFLASEIEERQCLFGGIFSDADAGDTIVFSVTGLPAGTGFSVDAVQGILFGTASDVDVAAEPIDVQFIASDGALQTAVSGRIRVREGQQENDPPVITGANPDAPVITPEDTPVEISLNNVLFEDPDNVVPDDHTLEVIEDASGTVYTSLGNVITPVATVPPGEAELVIEVQVVVNDGIDDSAIFNLPVTLTDVNFPPELVTPLDDQVGTEGEAFSLDVSGNFTDRDQDPLTFTQTGLPAGMSISAEGLISGVPAPGFFDVTVTADDGKGDGTASDSFTFAVKDIGGNSPPQLIGPIGDRTATVGQAVSFDTNTFFDDPDDDLLTYAAMGLPASLTIDSATGIIMGTPTVDDLAGSPYTVTVTATDPGGLFAGDTLELTVLPEDTEDTTPPVVSLNGDDSITLQVGSPFTDPGATAVDDVDGDLTDQIVVEGAVDTAVAGEYTLTYRATDAAGNTGEASRLVTVVEDAPPVVTLIGEALVTVQLGSVFIDPGATASDEVDGDLTDQIVVEGAVDTSMVGDYTLTYRVTDSAGNTGEASRVVTVVEDAPPVVTLIGENPISVQRGGTFVDPGATASDELDGDLTNQIVVTGAVDTSILGPYTLTYSVTDSGGNVGQATRTVNVTERSGGGGGGGGATGLWLLGGLLAGAGLRRRRSAR